MGRLAKVAGAACLAGLVASVAAASSGGVQTRLDVLAWGLKSQFAGLQAPGNGTIANSIFQPTMKFFENPQPVSDPLQREELEYIRSTVEWKNGLVLWVLPQAFRESLPLIVQGWIASVLLTYMEYFLSCVVWCLWVYKWYPNKQIEGKHPHWKDMKKQIFVSIAAIPLYAMLPPLSEHCILKGWTRTYGRISTVGVPAFLGHVALYMLSVEFGVYWQHRKMHDIRWCYRSMHSIHHIYNKEDTLSPFAGLAFHPMDGIMQAVPYVWSLFLIPMHYWTHLILLFCTGVWTANIHDCIHGKCEPIMGAGYHAIHHLTYKHNYGHYTTMFDWAFNSLLPPKQEAEAPANAEDEKKGK